MTQSPKLGIAVPCYRVEKGLVDLHRHVVLAAESAAGTDFEFIMVNDGSPDGTWAGTCALADADGRVVGVNLSRNHRSI